VDGQSKDILLLPMLAGVEGIIKASGQRMLTRGRIAGGADFSRGKVNVTLASQEQCSQLQQSY